MIETTVLDQETAQQLEVQRFYSLLYRAFEFTQGHDTAPEATMDYLHLIRPGWTIDDNLQHTVEARLKASVPRRMFPTQDPMQAESLRVYHPQETAINTPLTVTGAHANIARLIRIARACFEQPIDSSRILPEKTYVVGKLLRAIVQQDYKFIVDQGGRKRTMPYNPSKPDTDRFLSYFCYYALEGNTMNLAEYDEMFSDIKELAYKQIVNRLWTPRSFPELFETMSVYRTKHPETAQATQETLDLVA